MKIVSLYNKRIFLVNKYIALGTPDPYININLIELFFAYESGLTDTFNITSNTGYTITPSESWIGVNYASGSGNLTVTVEMLTANSGLVSRSGTITVQSLDSTITKTVTITQNFDSQPLLYIITEGGTFGGELVY